MAAIGWVDLVFFAAVALSVLVGLWRGLVFEVLSLVGWVVAYLAAQAWSDEVARWVPIGVPGDALNHGVAMAVTFMLALVAWGLMSRLLRMAIRATPLSGIDRVLGAAFGALRAAILLLVVTTIVLMTPAARSPAWQRSWVGPWATGWVASIKSFLPDAVRKHLDSPTLNQRA